MHMKRITIYFFLIFAGGILGWLLSRYYYSPKKPEDAISQIKPRPLDKYTIENMSKATAKLVTQPQMSKLTIDKVLDEKEKYTSYLFFMEFNPDMDSRTTKKISGQVNIPKGDGSFPVIVMFRGYVDQKAYKTGDGTRRAAEFFAKRGFITVAPDFLGYGESDPESANIFETRFQTYTTALALLTSITNNKLTNLPINQDEVFLWGHSNGGQIALTVLEVTQETYPTVLWAPVSKPFPYSILYYTDESDDRGKLIRHELAKFEETYDVELYSLTNYLDRIKAPLQIHQGTADDAVPIAWTNELSKILLDLDLNYYLYPGADHNLQPAWDSIVARDLTFFQKHLKIN